MHWVYILRCADGSLYVGETSDLEARLIAHNEGRSRHTSNRRPVVLLYSERFANRTLALAREKQIKGWTRKKKEALVKCDLEMLRRL